MNRYRFGYLPLLLAGSLLPLLTGSAFAQLSDEELRRERLETIEQLQYTEELSGSSSRLGAELLERYGWLMDYGGQTAISWTGGENNDRQSGELDSTDHNYDYDLNAFLSVSNKSKAKFYVRFSTKYTEQKKASTAGSTRGNDLIEPNFDMIYFEKPIVSKDHKHEWKVGRQYVSVGRGIAFGQTSDGINYSIREAKGKIESYKFFALRQKPSADIPDYYNASTQFQAGRDQRQFYGLEIKMRWTPSGHKATFFYVINDDKNPDTNPLSSRHQFDSKYFGAGMDGPLPFMANLTYFAEYIRMTGENFGAGVSALNAQRDDMRSYALDCGLKYRFAGNKYDPSVYGQYSVASGDPDRTTNTTGSTLTAGNTAGTTDESFHGLGGLSLGYALAPTFSNIRATHFGGTIKPWAHVDEGVWEFLSDVTATMAFYKYRTDASGPTGDVFGAQPTAATASDDVGEEWNWQARWKILSDLKSDLRLGYFKPGGFYGGRRAREIYAKYKFTVDL